MMMTFFIIIAVWILISAVFWIAATTWPQFRTDWLDRLPIWLEPILLVVLIVPGMFFMIVKETIADKIFEYKLTREREKKVNESKSS